MTRALFTPRPSCWPRCLVVAVLVLAACGSQRDAASPAAATQRRAVARRWRRRPPLRRKRRQHRQLRLQRRRQLTVEVGHHRDLDQQGHRAAHVTSTDGPGVDAAITTTLRQRDLWTRATPSATRSTRPGPTTTSARSMRRCRPMHAVGGGQVAEGSDRRTDWAPLPALIDSGSRTRSSRSPGGPPVGYNNGVGREAPTFTITAARRQRDQPQAVPRRLVSGASSSCPTQLDRRRAPAQPAELRRRARSGACAVRCSSSATASPRGLSRRWPAASTASPFPLLPDDGRVAAALRRPQEERRGASHDGHRRPRRQDRVGGRRRRGPQARRVIAAFRQVVR